MTNPASSSPPNRATYGEFLDYLLELSEVNDPRLGDTITVYDSVLGEFLPAEFVEFNGDDILDEGSLVLMTKDWNE